MARVLSKRTALIRRWLRKHAKLVTRNIEQAKEKHPKAYKRCLGALSKALPGGFTFAQFNEQIRIGFSGGNSSWLSNDQRSITRKKNLKQKTTALVVSDSQISEELQPMDVLSDDTTSELNPMLIAVMRNGESVQVISPMGIPHNVPAHTTVTVSTDMLAQVEHVTYRREQV